MPLGLLAPWKSTRRWASAASFAASKYQLATFRLAGGGKSIFTPTTPASTVLRKNSLRATGSLTKRLCTHIQTLTFFVFA